MAQLVISAAGAAIGFVASGGNPMGAQIGWAIGGALGGALFKPDAPSQPAPAVMDLRITGTEYGQPIPWVRGKIRTGGLMVWNSNRRPRTVTTSSGGGKGGAPETESSQTLYGMSMLYLLSDNEGVGIARIWNDGKLVWTNDSGATSESRAASDETGHWERITFYSGAADQLPDPEYEDEVGAANAIAYRGRSTVFISSIQLGPSGQVPNLTFELVIDGTIGSEFDELPMQQYFPEWIHQYSCVYPSTQASDEHVYFIHYTDVPDPAPFYEYEARLARAPLSDPSDYEDLTEELQAWVLAELGTEGVYQFLSPPIYVAAQDACYFVINSAISGSRHTRVIRYGVTANALSISERLQSNPDSDLGIYHGRIFYDSVQDCLFVLTVDDFGAGDGNTGIAKVDATTLAMIDIVPAVALFNVSSGLSFDPIKRLIVGTGDRTGVSAIVVWSADTLEVLFEMVDREEGFQDYNNCVAHDGYLWIEVGKEDGESYEYHVRKYLWNDSAQTYSYVSTPFDATALGFGWPSINYVPSENALLLSTFTNGADTTSATHMSPELRDVDDDSVIQTFAFSGHSDYYYYYNSMYVPSGGFLIYGYNADVAEPADPYSDTPGYYTQWRFVSGAVTAECPTVEDVQSDICLRAGMTADQFDVTELSSITKDVCSISWSQSPARSPTELLMSSHFYEITVSDKIHFRPRGGAAVVTIPYEDLGASADVGEQPDPLALKLANEIEIPAQKAVTYVNLSDDYQTDTQLSDRLVSATSQTIESVQMALGMTPSEAKAIADTMLLDQTASFVGTNIALLGDYARLEPTDVVILTAADSSTFRMRLVKKTDSYPLLSFEAVLDDASVLVSQGITSADYTPSTEVVAPPDTVMELMDIPILQDADDDAGFYVAAKGDGEPWPGAAILGSPDGVTYTRKATVSESAVLGECSTTLGDWYGPRVIDELNSVTVDVGEGVLESSTRTAVLDDQSINAVLVGSEVIQFITATIVTPGVYTLTRLLRGCRGTEWAMVDHAATERFVLLRPAGMRRIAVENSELGLSRYYKGVTLDRLPGTATPEQFVDNGVGLKPFSPVDLRVSRDGSGNITLTCQRRTRLAVRMIGALGISVPLGEEEESYEWEIYADGTYATLLTTILTSAPTATYSAADQVIDFGSIQNPVYCRVHQVSATVGAGYDLEMAV